MPARVGLLGRRRQVRGPVESGVKCSFSLNHRLPLSSEARDNKAKQETRACHFLPCTSAISAGSTASGHPLISKTTLPW